jgi:hypothetical protein
MTGFGLITGAMILLDGLCKLSREIISFGLIAYYMHTESKKNGT